MSKKTIDPANVRFVFFGTPALAVNILNELEAAGFSPALVVTTPDKPRGRGQHMQPTPVKEWATTRDIDVVTPEKIDADFVNELKNTEWDMFIVMAYGLILPKALIDIPAHGTLNVHPSLLPKLRGASPIRSAILTDARDAVGVTIMLMDEKMDHGPIVSQLTIELDEWPARGTELDELLTHQGGPLLARTIPHWLAGEITPFEQDHSAATFSKKFTKDDMHIDLSGEGSRSEADKRRAAYANLCNIHAFEGFPGAYTFFEKDESSANRRIRVTILEAHLSEDGSLVIDTVKPEGKSAMPYDEFIKTGAMPA
jgi:methionyl-tRNA formyltransferase